jgi:transposase
MSGAEFLLDCPGLRVMDLDIERDAVAIHVEPTASASTCPQCGTAAVRVHSRYPRTITDLPIHGRRAVLRITARRFFCDQPHCPRTLFCERFPQLTTPHARTTGPLAESHQAIGFALGGEAGARLADKLAVPTSPDTLLRRVKAAPDEPLPPARYIGIDDWATRKGQHYGTILIDLERHCVIDILPGRDGVALKKWLQEHPSVEVVTRDRWAAFAQAVREGAPAAKQVADRWHLLKNLREAVERVLARFSPEIAKVAHALDPAEGSTTAPSSGEEQPTALVPTPPAPPAAGAPVPPPTARPPREQARQAKRDAREQQHRLVREMRDQGHSIRATARLLGISRQVVIRYRRQDTCPDWKPGRKGPSQLDEYRELVAEWIGGGGRNAKVLHRLLGEKGCKASYDAVRRYVNRKIGSTGRPGRRTGAVKPPAPSVPSSRKLSFQFICPPKEAKTESPSDGVKPGLLDRVRKSIPGLGTALDVASELAAMIRKEVTRPLSEWLAKADASGVSELKTFSQGLREDEAAVTAALTEAWSNGPVEGQVNRLKFIKRSMYGRAGWRLLRARVKRKD